MDRLYKLDDLDAVIIAACASLSLDGVEGVQWSDKERKRLERAIDALTTSGLSLLELKQKETDNNE